jgi:hypothetical protein
MSFIAEIVEVSIRSEEITNLVRISGNTGINKT